MIIPEICESHPDNPSPNIFPIERRKLIELLSSLSEEGTEERALNGYRAAVSFISADAWDGCSDCIEILRAARALDTDWNWAGDPDRIARELRRVREAAALSSTTPSPSRDEIRAPIMLEIAKASDEHAMWERRLVALQRMYAIDRCFADQDGRWGLRDFLEYAAAACGFASSQPPIEGEEG